MASQPSPSISREMLKHGRTIQIGNQEVDIEIKQVQHVIISEKKREIISPAGN
jgi:hypothetical protein